ncbi:hypothetical protein [Streptomyces megasporus]|uniref:hypothetical protein n=1 Tax=Streptomyces megasporus TaxID=44060 RepID=UPI000B069629
MQLPAGSASSSAPSPAASSAPSPSVRPEPVPYVPSQPVPAAPSSPPPSRPAPAHTRARAAHWIVTAAALGAVLGGSALLGPAGATATPGPNEAAAPGPDAGEARYPLDCGPVEPEVIDEVAVDFDGDERAETVAVVRCAAGIGTPPSGMYVLAHPAREGARPRVAETLVDPDEGMTVQRLTVRGDTVLARLLGYSSNEVPRCCPDRMRDVEWNWRDGKFVLRAVPTARSV